MKILLVGEDCLGWPMLILNAFQKLGIEADFINTHKYFKTSFINRVVNKLLPTPYYFGRGVRKVNKAVIEKASGKKFNFIIFLKPTLIYPETITKLKEHAKIIGWYSDHADYLKTNSTYFYKTISLFDHYFSLIKSNVEVMTRLGAKKSTYLMITADPLYHHPVEISTEDVRRLGADVVFVGNYADERRAKYLEQLCRDRYNILIYGNGWHKLPKNSCLRSNDRIRGGVYREDMARVMGSSKIVVAFMRERNDEKIGCRTYEIPLCRGFMLHERTKEAEQLLTPGVDADFFGSYEEFKEKIDFYLAHPELRQKIAQAGYERILNSGELIYDRVGRLIEILKAEFLT